MFLRTVFLRTLESRDNATVGARGSEDNVFVGTRVRGDFLKLMIASDNEATTQSHSHTHVQYAPITGYCEKILLVLS